MKKFILSIISLTLIFMGVGVKLAANEAYVSQDPNLIVHDHQLEGIDFSWLNFESSYQDGDDIDLVFSTNLIENDFDFQEKGLILEGQDKDVDNQTLTLSIDLVEEEPYLTIITEEFTETIYFVKNQDLFFSSSVSYQDAKIKSYQHDLVSELIDEKEYDLLVNELYSPSVDDQLIITSSSFLGSTIVINTDLNWIDDSNNSHSLNYTKVEIIERVYFSGTIDDYYYDHVIKTSYTNNEGKLSYSHVTNVNYPTGYYLKIYSEGENTKVVDSSNNVYQFSTPVANNLPNGAVINYGADFDMTSDLGRGFQLSQASIYSAKYARYLNGGTNITFATIHYGNVGTYYDRNNHIYIKAVAGSSYRPNAYADWDVLGHEYAHHIQKFFGISDNPGGTHSVPGNHLDYRHDNIGETLYNAKEKGTRLTWAEGWASYSGLVFQHHFASELDNIQYVNDTWYTAANGVRYNLNGYGYWSTTYGEGDEIAVSQILYNLYDNSNDTYDVFTYSDMTLFNIVKQNKPYRLSTFIQNMYANSINKATFGKFLARYNISPQDLEITAGNYVDVPATYMWDGSGGSKYFSNNLYTIVFLNQNKSEIFRVTNLGAEEFTPTLDQWSQISNAFGSSYYVYIIGYATQEYSTGPYYSEHFQFSKPNTFASKHIVYQHDYGYEQQYFFYSKSKQITAGGITFNTNRLRAGYIEEEFINLSPRRSGAGVAYLEYSFTEKVYRADINLSFWGPNEYINSSNATAVIQYKNAAGEWITVLDLLNDVTLSKNRNNQDTYSIIFPNGTYEYRFYMTSDAIGTNNRGRISIGSTILYMD